MEGRGRRTPPGPPGTAFVGRGAELAILEGLLDKTLAGSSHFVVVEGEAGMGKTRLLDEILAHPDAAGSFVYRAQAEELQPRPFGLLADALGIDASSPDPERRGLAHLLGAGEDREATDQRYRVMEGVLDLVERQAIAGPVVIALDDVQWADPSSAETIHVLNRRLAYLPVLVLMACRPLPRPPELARLVNNLSDVGGHHLRLDPLGELAVSELAASRLGADPGPVLRDRLEGAAGNPLFLLELLDALSEEGVIDIEAGVAEATSAVEPPPSLRMTVVRRLAFLEPASIELLRSACVLGGSFSAAELSVVTGKPLLDVLTTLREPIASGFVTAAGERFAFRHDVVREALYLELPPAVRKGLHLHVGRSLAAAGAAPAEVANHLALGAEFGDREAVAWLHRAAEELRPQAPGLAVQLLDRAASLLPAQDPEGLSLVREQVRTMAMAGRVREAEALAGSAVAQVSDPSAALQLSVTQVDLLLLQFKARQADELANRLLGAESLPEKVRAQLLVLSFVARAALGDLRGAMTRVAEVTPFAEAHPGSPPAVALLMARGGTAMIQGFWREAGEIARETLAVLATERVQQVGVDMSYIGFLARERAQARAQTQLYLGVFQTGADCFDEARATLDRTRAELERLGNVSLVVEHHWFLAGLHFAAGRWDDALAEMVASKQLTAETGAFGIRVLIADHSSMIQLQRGDLVAAQDALATIEEDPTHGATTFAGLWTGPMRALVQDAAGQPVTAVHTLENWHEFALGMTSLPDYRGIGRALVRLCRAQGNKEFAERMATDAAEARKRARGVASIEGTALLLRGMVEEDPEGVVAAVEAFRAAARPFDLAEACAEAAVTLLSRGRDGEGRALLAEAFDLYEGLGASRCEAALAREVRAFGIRRGARRPHTRAVSGWSALTGTEERIVGLVAEGLTNAEIGERLYISRGTVATHLRSVFRKVEVSSRAELAAGAARHLA